MKRNRVKDLVFWFKMEYEKVRLGYTYTPGGQDWKEAKEYLELVDEPDYESLAKCIPGYFRSDYWETRGYPCYGFLRDPNQYAPKVERVSKPSAMMVCGGCGQVHGVNEKCKPQVNA